MVEETWAVPSDTDPDAIEAAVRALGGEWGSGAGVIAADVALSRVAAGVSLRVYLVCGRNGAPAALTLSSAPHTGCAAPLVVGLPVGAGLVATGHWILAFPVAILAGLGARTLMSRAARPAEVRRQFDEARTALERVCPLG